MLQKNWFLLLAQGHSEDFFRARHNSPNAPTSSCAGREVKANAFFLYTIQSTLCYLHSSPVSLNISLKIRSTDESCLFSAGSRHSCVNRGYYMAARVRNFIFECCYPLTVYHAIDIDILSAPEDKIRFPKRPCNVLFILQMLMNSYIKHNFCFYSFSKQQNSAIKVVTHRKMPVTKMLWNLDIKL